MGNCCSISDEVRRGAIRSRFTLDDAPEDIPKSVEHVATPPDAPMKNPKDAPLRKRFHFPLIGHKNIEDRHIVLNSFFPSPTKTNRTISDDKYEASHHLTLVSDLYEYLPQVPLSLVGLTYHARHPSLRDTLYFLSYRNNPLTKNRRWTKEVYGTTWPTVVRSSAVHTYDPVLKHHVRTIKIKDLLIYDSKDYIHGSVYIVIRDSDGNEHAIVPFPGGRTRDGHQYGVRLEIEQDCYVNEIDDLVKKMRERLEGISDRTEKNTREVREIKPEAETKTSDIETTDGAVGDTIGDGVETDDEDGINDDDITTGPRIRGKASAASAAARVMEEVMGEKEDDEI